MTAPVLRPYQSTANEAIVRAFLEQGQNRLLEQMATGLGKTVGFSALIHHRRLAGWMDSLPKRGARVLVIAHREELLTQAQAKIQASNPGLAVSIEQGELVASRYSDVIVASIQTLAARKFTRLLRLIERHDFRLVICDESHHAPAATYRTALALLGFMPKADITENGDIEAATQDDVIEMEKALQGWDLVSPKDRLLVGVTATPNRTDAIGLGCIFQSLAYTYPLKQAIDDGWLVPITSWIVTTDTSLDGVKISHGEFNQRQLADTVNTPARNRLAIEALKRYAPGRPTLGFTVDVQHAHDLAAVAVEQGLRAQALSGETPKEDRRLMLRAYTEGQIDAIMNCMVLTEGTDLPLTSCILHAKPTKSCTLYEQISGRGLRPHPDDPIGPERAAASRFLKPDCILIDVVDISRRHSLQTAPVLYGLPPALTAKGKDLRELADDLEKFREEYPNFDLDAALKDGTLSVEQLRLKAKTFDVWSVPTLGDLAGAVTMNWIRYAADSFRLQYPWGDGTEVLTVSGDLLGHFDLSCTLRPRGTLTGVRQRTIATQVPTAVAALQLAEQFIDRERASVKKLKDKDAPWRHRPASPKQVALLQKLRIPFDARKVTMGEASDKIDLSHAKRGR